MAFNPPGPRSRTSLLRRSGIGVSVLAIALAGLARAAGWRPVLTGAAVFGGAVILFIAVRKIRARRPGPGGMRIPRMPRIGGAPAPFRVPSGLRGRGSPFRPGSLPPGLRLPRGAGRSPMGRALRAHRAGRPGMPAFRSPTRAPGRTGRTAGRGTPGSRPGLPRAGSRTGLRSPASVSRARRLGTPAPGRTGRRFRPPGSSRPGGPGTSRPGRTFGPSGRRSASGTGTRTRRPAARTAAVFRRAVRRMRGTASPAASGWRPASPVRGGPRRRWRGIPVPSFRRRRRASRSSGTWRPRVRVRGGPRRRWRMPWRRAVRPAPVRPYASRRRHAVLRSARRWLRVSRRRFSRTRVRVRRLRVTGRFARLRGSLLFWRRIRRPRAAGGGPSPVAGTVYTVRPPSGSADPYSGRMPRPAEPMPFRPATAAPAAPEPEPSYSGGPQMGSSPITPVIEAVNQHLGGFKPENAMDFTEFFKDMPGLFETMAAGIGKATDTLAEQSPIDAAITEEMREYVALLNGLRDKATEVNAMFRRKHEVELRRLEDPRSGERDWDVAANA